MVDLHSHILPNIDDGSKSKRESLAILKTSNKNNTNINTIEKSIQKGLKAHLIFCLVFISFNTSAALIIFLSLS